jgi:outer membrane receptor protein involved in Fe transport
VILLRDWKLFTLCFAVINLFDEKYEIRDGRASEFSPEFGPGRSYFFGFSQKFQVWQASQD